MKECLGCLGDGELDLRDMDAVILEHFTREELVAQGFVLDGPRVIPCEVCAGTGEIEDDVHADLVAKARAEIEQILAKVHEREKADGRRS